MLQIPLRSIIAPHQAKLQLSSCFRSLHFFARPSYTPSLPSRAFRSTPTRLTTNAQHSPRPHHPKPPPSLASSAEDDPTEDPNTLLTEYVYGRTRIYTSLPPTTKRKTTSMSSVSPPARSPLYWSWQRQSTRPQGIPETKEGKRRRKFFALFGGLMQDVRELYLPVGYPEAVHECYARFHAWLFLETYVGSAIGVLCSQAMLASLGLGTAEATGGAVAIQWVLKDGFGEIGKLYFIKRWANSFDSHPKSWKFVCEILDGVGSFLQLCTAITPSKYFLPLASVGNAFGFIHESIWAASHMSFTRNFALRGNVADVVAKDDAQMSTAHLLGLLSGVGLITISASPAFLFTSFFVLFPLNIWSTVRLLRTANFEILNQAKLTLLSRVYIDQGKVVTMDQLKGREIGFGEWIKPFGQRGGVNVKIKLGASASDAFADSAQVRAALDVMRSENYLLNYHANVMHILFHVDAESNDVIRSILHSLRFHDVLTAEGLISAKQANPKDEEKYMEAMKKSLEWTKDKFPQFVAELDAMDWQSDVVFWKDGGQRLDWARPEKIDDM